MTDAPDRACYVLREWLLGGGGGGGGYLFNKVSYGVTQLRALNQL